MHFETYVAVVIGLYTLAKASPIMEAREPHGKADPHYDEDHTQSVTVLTAFPPPPSGPIATPGPRVLPLPDGRPVLSEFPPLPPGPIATPGPRALPLPDERPVLSEFPPLPPGPIATPGPRVLSLPDGRPVLSEFPPRPPGPIATPGPRVLPLPEAGTARVFPPRSLGPVVTPGPRVFPLPDAPPRSSSSLIRSIRLDPFPPGAPLFNSDPIPPTSTKTVIRTARVDPYSPAAPLVNSHSTPTATAVTTGTDPIQGLPGPDIGEPKSLNFGEPIPFLPGDELCFSTDLGRTKRATPENDDEVPLRTTLIDYIKGVIVTFEGDKCPSKALLKAPLKAPLTNKDDGHPKRSAPLSKRQPQTIAELIKLVISVYNQCPEDGYRKRAFRPGNLEA